LRKREITQLKEQLISTISHELRTPLSVISVTSSVLEKYRDRLTSEQQSERLHGIMAQVRRLDEMLDQVSTLSKAHRGFLQFEPQAVEVIGLLRKVISEMQVHLQTGQQLNLDVDETIGLVHLDERLIWHVLVNLISNAIKYSPDGGVISLNVSQDDNFLMINVQDEGIGIPESDLKNLFEPFQRAGNVGGIGGTGLGLSIVKEIVGLHHGSISCASQEGFGTTFTIHIPVTRAA
jgi:signal transduction histidine kinase